jgi:protein-L-isoaspartate(D-aspartate) O-methyltransferase
MINDSGIVVGVEHIKQLYDMSIKNICKHHENLIKEQKVILDNCDGRMGYKKYAPYKAIHVGAAAPSIPDELINQLDFNGRMFIPVGGQNEAQWIYIIDKDSKGNITQNRVLSVNYVPLTDAEKQLRNIRKK